MSDSTDLVRRFARLRVPVGFAFGVLAFALATPTATMVVAGAMVAVLGEAIRVWAAGHLNKAREVTMSGPYRFVAHPLYVGSSVMAGGLAIACANLAVAGLIAIYLVVALTAAVKSEEAFLRQTFGDRYDRYRRGDAAGIVERRFSLAQAMRNREWRAVVGLALAVLLLAWKATYNEPFGRAAGTRIVRPGG